MSDSERKSVTKIGSVVKMSNDLARAYWPTRSVWEIRIVTAVSTLVKTSDDDFHTYRIPFAELTREHSLSGNYDDIKRAVESLVHRAVKIVGRNKKDFRIYNIFAVCGIENGCVIAGFHPDLKPLFLNLQKEYTLYRAMDIMHLRSSYSQKLFLLLKSWSGLPEITVPLSELHARLATTDSLKSYGNFKKRVLIPCHKSICENTQIMYEWEEIKRGRSVEKIRFIFKRKKDEDGLISADAFKQMRACKGGRLFCDSPDGDEKCMYCVLAIGRDGGTGAAPDGKEL